MTENNVHIIWLIKFETFMKYERVKDGINKCILYGWHYMLKFY